MIFAHSGTKTGNLKYRIAEYNHPLDYMRAVMAAIRSGQPSSIHSNQIIFFDISQKCKSYLDLDI